MTFFSFFLFYCRCAAPMTFYEKYDNFINNFIVFVLKKKTRISGQIFFMNSKIRFKRKYNCYFGVDGVLLLLN